MSYGELLRSSNTGSSQQSGHAVFLCVCVPQAVVWQLGKICAVMRAALALHVTRICRNSDVVPSLFSIYVVCSLVA